MRKVLAGLLLLVLLAASGVTGAVVRGEGFSDAAGHWLFRQGYIRGDLVLKLEEAWDLTTDRGNLHPDRPATRGKVAALAAWLRQQARAGPTVAEAQAAAERAPDLRGWSHPGRGRDHPRPAPRPAGEGRGPEAPAAADRAQRRRHAYEPGRLPRPCAGRGRLRGARLRLSAPRHGPAAAGHLRGLCGCHALQAQFRLIGEVAFTLRTPGYGVALGLPDGQVTRGTGEAWLGYRLNINELRTVAGAREVHPARVRGEPAAPGRLEDPPRRAHGHLHHRLDLQPLSQPGLARSPQSHARGP